VTAQTNQQTQAELPQDAACAVPVTARRAARPAAIITFRIRHSPDSISLP
jgi:hypothetical protein